jgi:hypothetical protein
VYNKAVLSCSNKWCNNLDFDCWKWWTLCLLWHWMQNKLTLRFWALVFRCYASSLCSAAMQNELTGKHYMGQQH